jgi:hypothetical protein
MPKVKVKMNTPSEDSLNKAKKRTAAKNKRKYKGVDVPADAPASGIVGDTSGMTATIVSKLTDMVASVNELSSQLNLTAGKNAPWASKAIDKYISASSSLRKQTADLNAYLESQAGQLSSLNDFDASKVSAAYQDLVDGFGEITASLTKESPGRQQALKKVFGVFVPQLTSLSETLTGKVLSQLSSGQTSLGVLAPAVVGKIFSGRNPDVVVAPQATKNKRTISGLPAAADTTNPEQIPDVKPAWVGDVANFFQQGIRKGQERSATEKAAYLRNKSPSKKATDAGGDPSGLDGVAQLFGKGFRHRAFGTFASGGALMFEPYVRRMPGSGLDACGRHAGTRYYGSPCGVGGGVDLGVQPYMPTRFL